MFFGLLALLIPGIMIAYVLPLIPWVMWIAGVTGYLILVLEAVIAVPLMMVAHMTFDGEGLHGRAIQVYELLFNVLFRPGPDASRLFAGYFVFSSVSWLIRISSCRRAFSSRKGLVRHQSDREVVLLAIFVLLHIVVAIKAFGFDLAHPTSCAEGCSASRRPTASIWTSSARRPHGPAREERCARSITMREVGCPTRQDKMSRMM